MTKHRPIKDAVWKVIDGEWCKLHARFRLKRLADGEIEHLNSKGFSARKEKVNGLYRIWARKK